MSTLADTPLPSPVTPEPRRPLTLPLFARFFAAVLALLIVGGGIGWLVYIHHYQPIGDYGLYPAPGPNAAPITDGVRRTGYIATGATGSVSRIRTTIRNDGHFDIRLLGLPPDEAGPIRIQVKWMPITGDWSVLERPESAWKTGPITLHPGEGMGVSIEVERPKCSQGLTYTMDSVAIRWSSLGVHHIYNLTFSDPNEDVPFYSCYSQSALKHIEPGFPS